MEDFKDIEEALAAQIIAQTQVINDNNHKGDALGYALEFDDTEGERSVMVRDINNNIFKLHLAERNGDIEAQKKYAINVLNYTLFYMINRRLI